MDRRRRQEVVVESVNVGGIAGVSWGRITWSAIDKSPVATRVVVGPLGLRHWIKRFTQHGRPGAYLRVIEEGELGAGDGIDVVERRPHTLTVAYAFRALTTERHLLPGLAAEPRCGRAIMRRLAKAPVN